ncbi:PREDICTED: glycerate 2-kinase-like, partial [Cyphomyrmex costatus]|uniref:glycerate 2-kinase-like n=1 Tax=Cyphomyrmex costatus TaxID=456900 RepID=UPI0008524210
ACGLALSERREPLAATSVGVGELLNAAVQSGARRCVVGLGGSATNDAGAGFLHALGATGDRPLDRGPAAFDGITTCDLTAVRQRLNGVELTIASDVESVLLGMFGASKTFGLQKGLSDDEIIRVDAILDNFVNAVCGRTPSQRAVADARGAGAAGGLGFAMLALGAQFTSGIDLIAEATGLVEAMAVADLVVTGEGKYDFSSRAGKVVYGVARNAASVARPCIVLAGKVDVGAREMRAMGVQSAYSMTDIVGEDASVTAAADSLRRLAARVARTWSR